MPGWVSIFSATPSLCPCEPHLPSRASVHTHHRPCNPLSPARPATFSPSVLSSPSLPGRDPCLLFVRMGSLVGGGCSQGDWNKTLKVIKKGDAWIINEIKKSVSKDIRPHDHHRTPYWLVLFPL